jgi:hypothetical protein
VTLDKSGNIRKNSMGPGGLFVQIQHKDNLQSEYMHLLNYLVKMGQWVKAGDIIGHVGDTGIHVDAAHLHFQMREGGEIIDPMIPLAPYLISPLATYRGQTAVAAMPARWRVAKHRLRAEAASRREQRQRDLDRSNADNQANPSPTNPPDEKVANEGD